MTFDAVRYAAIPGGMMLSMDPLSAVAAGLSGLKTASDLTTRIREALGSREVKLDEVVARIIEIQGLISDGRTAFIDVQEQILEKNQEIFQLQQACTKLTERLEKKTQGRKHDNAVWKVLDDGTEDGPYCPNCWEQKGHFIQPKRGASNVDYFSFFCDEHGARAFSFHVPSHLCDQKLVVKKQEPRPTPRLRSDFR